jgi:hypothetical protein
MMMSAEERFIRPWPIRVYAVEWPIWNNRCEMLPEVAEWLDQNVKTPDGWEVHEMFCIVVFKDAVDAVHFKLRWR